MASSGSLCSTLATGEKFSSHSYSVSSNAFFTTKDFITLKAMASIECINLLGSVELVKEYLQRNPRDGLFDDIQDILSEIKKLHQYVVDNKVEEVDDFLAQMPLYFLPVLLKTQGKIITSAKGHTKSIEVEGTALKLALGAESVGRDGCDLCLMPAHLYLEDTHSKKISLYSDNNLETPFRYRIKGKEWTIERGNNGDQLNSDHFDVLKGMFNDAILFNQYLNLSHRALNEVQRDAYSALLNITSQREHTLNENEEGMVEVLQRHFKKFPDGEAEMLKQIGEQFPTDWEKEEENRHVRDMAALIKVRQAISDSVSCNDPKLVVALEEFKNHFEPKSIINTGKYSNVKPILAALELAYNKYFYDDRKDDLFYNQVISYLQRLASMNYKHDMAQGLHNIFDLGKKSNRSLHHSYGDGSFSSSVVPNAKVGFSPYVDCFRLGTCLYFGCLRCLCIRFSKLCSNKSSIVAAYCTMSRQASDPTKRVLLSH